MAKTSTDKAVKKPSRFSPKRIASRTAKYFKDLRSEIKKIVWPGKKQVINNTIVVIVMVLIAAVVLWGLDSLLGLLVQLLLKNA